MAKTTILEKIESVLYSGAVFTNSGSSNDSETGSYSTNYSPNNLKTVILSPEGMVFVFHTTTGNQKRLVRQVNFPQNEETFNFLTEEKELLSFLVDKRVYSSVEEIILIATSGYEPMFKLPKRQLNIIQTKLIGKLKRLRDVIVIAEIRNSLEDFKQYYEVELKKDNYSLAENEDLASQEGVNIIKINPKWYTAISLRPSYYKLDDKDGDLYRKFNTTKMQYDSSDSSNNKEEVKTGNKDNETSTQGKVTAEHKRYLNDISLMFGLYKALQDNPLGNQDMIEKVTSSVEQTYSYLESMYTFSPFGLGYYFSEESVSSNPELERFNQFITPRLKSNAKEIDLSEVKEFRDNLLEIFITKVRKIYYANKKKKKTTQSKTHTMINDSLNRGFVRLYKRPEYSNFYNTMKNQQIELNKEFVSNMLSLLQFPFTDNTIESTTSITYTGNLQYNTVERLRQSEDIEETPLYALIKMLFWIEKGFTYNPNQPTQATLEITHDWLNLSQKMSYGYFSKALSETATDNSNTKHKVLSFDVTNIWTKLDKMLDESGIRGTENVEPELDIIEDEQFEILEDLKEEEQSVTNTSELNETNPEKSVQEVDSNIIDDLEEDILEVSIEDTDEIYIDDSERSEEAIKELQDDEKDLDDKVELESEELETTWKPDKSVKMYMVWLGKLENVLSESNNSAVMVLDSNIKTICNESLEFLQDSEIDTIDKDTQDYLIDVVLQELNTVEDNKVKIYLNMKHIYFNRLKTINTLSSQGVLFTNGFERYFKSNSTTPKPVDTYTYIKTLYYIIKGRIK